MRCSECGSGNVNVETQQTSSYSYKKGIFGAFLIGPLGAIAGIGGKRKTDKQYHCMACGRHGDYSQVVMNANDEFEISSAFQRNDVAKLNILKKKYRNIEWTPPIVFTPIYSSPVKGTPQSTIGQKPPLEEFKINGGVLIEYNGTKSSVVIPNSVTSIGGSAFAGCKKLTSITIPNSVTSIGGSAFLNCTGIKSLFIPKSVTLIENNIIEGNELEEISVEEGNPNYRSEGNCLIRIADNTLMSVCKNSKIPNYIEAIGEGAFAGCEKLTSITIPNSVISIGEFAFSACKNLTSITIPNGVASIGESAFSGCTGIKSLFIPKSVTSIKNNIIDGCDNLETISVEEGNPNYRSEGNCLIRIADNALMSVCKNSNIPDYIEVIGKNVFHDSDDNTIDKILVIPKNVIRIEEKAYDYMCLDSIVIPEKVNFIGKRAFFCDAVSLRTVTFSNPHGWFIMTDEDTDGTPIDDKILGDPQAAAEFIQNMEYDSYLCKK